MTDKALQELMPTVISTESLVYSEDFGKTVEQINNKDIILCLGDVGSGKSTIINHIIGNKMKTVHEEGNIFKIETETKDKGPIISDISTNTIPTAWPTKNTDEFVMEFSPIINNYSVERDVANSFFVKEIVSNAKTAKFVLVIDIINVLRDDIHNFLDFLDNICKLIPHCSTLCGSMVIAFNKDKDNTTNESICNILKTLIVKNSPYQDRRHIIDYFSIHSNQIVITKKPMTANDVLDGSLFSDLVTVIQNNAASLPKTVLTTIEPGISDRSRLFLTITQRHFNKFVDEFDQVLQSAVLAFKNHLQHPFYRYSPESILVLEQSFYQLSNILTALVLSKSKIPIDYSIFKLNKIFTFYRPLEQHGDVYRKLKFHKYFSAVLDINQGDMSMKVFECLSQMTEEAATVRANMQDKLHENAAARLQYQHSGCTRGNYYELQKSTCDNSQQVIDRLLEQIETSNSRTFCVIL